MNRAKSLPAFSRAAQTREGQNTGEIAVGAENYYASTQQRLTQENSSTEKRYCRFSQIGRVYLLPIDNILPNPSQPRKHFDDRALIRLADSIRRYGILQPLAVRCVTDNADDIRTSYFELIAGERRLRACRMLQLKEVPCIMVEADSKKSAELAMIENIQRENLDMFEQAEAIKTLIDSYHMTQEEIARRLSSSQSYVANKLRILRLGEEERQIVLNCGLGERHARSVLKITDRELRVQALRYISCHAMTVTSAEEYVDRLIEHARKEPIRQMEYKLLRKDIRLFYNTVDRAVEMVRHAGIAVVSNRYELGDGVEMVIRLPHPYQTSEESTKTE